MDRFFIRIGVQFVAFAIFACAQQRQHFREEPSNQEVVEGQTGVIKCEVGNQAGRVQWAKDGFVLGFNRSIPGYPRYKMVGDENAGEHHLHVYNSTLKDDADYQCQVGPADGHPPIRATAHLTVLMAPSSISLSGRGREDVIEVTEGEEVTLECLVENAKPVASIRWFKNDKEIKLDSRMDVTEESTIKRRFNTMSKMTLRLTSRSDGSHYSCIAEHKALSRPIKASVRISVLYPPGPPVIYGYTEGEVIRAGEERTLSCRSRGGNPLGKVVWYRSGEVVDSADRPLSNEKVNDYKFVVAKKDNEVTYTCEVRNKLTEKPLRASVKLNVTFVPDVVKISGPMTARIGENVTFTCVARNSNPPSIVSWVVDGQPKRETSSRREKGGAGGWHTISQVAISVAPRQSDMRIACHATHQALGNTTYDVFVLSVLRPPQPPVLYGYQEGIGIRAGTTRSIKCISKGGNPPATLQWYRNGHKISSQNDQSGDESRAKIAVHAERQHNGAQFRCEAQNPAAPSPVSVSTTLIVYFPPDSVKIRVQPAELSAESMATLTCETGPSNPPAIVSWYRGGYQMAGKQVDTSQTSNGGTRVTNELHVNLTTADDGQTYKCKAANRELQREVQDQVVLRVKYPPQFLAPPPEEVKIVAGESLTLNLSVEANPSAVTYSWTRHGLQLAKPNFNEQWRQAYVIDPSASGTTVSADGPLLYLRGVRVEDTGEYELKAANEEGVTAVKLQVDVQYSPSVKFTSQEVTVSEGQEARLECGADGNPLSEAMMEWVRDEYDFKRTQRTFGNRKATLSIKNANRNDTGVFTCVIDNGIGSPVKANVTLIVRSIPLMDRSEQLNRAASDVGRTGRLRCKAYGFPNITFVWKRDAGPVLSSQIRPDKYATSSQKVGLTEFASTLDIRSVKNEDYGVYECVGENEMGQSSVTIKFTPPTIPDPPLTLKVVNATHDAITLTWEPGFDGGKRQYFRIRYRGKEETDYDYVDVMEPGLTTYLVTNLNLDSEYYFSIRSSNDVGDSSYRGEYVRGRTLDEAPPTPVPSSNVGKESAEARLPGLWVVIIALVATALLALNVSAIICIIRRKRRKRVPTKKQQHIDAASSKAIALSASSTQFEGSDQASSKSTTNTMYAPSSYNDTVVGETLSSISEKSRESYTQDDSVGEYEEQTHKHAASTYLIDQIDPPPEYASQAPPGHPSFNAYGAVDDDYAEVLRRNAYNQQLGKATPRPPSRATHYSTSPEQHGYISYSYSPSPTTIPNGAAHFCVAGPTEPHPSVTLRLQDHAYPPGTEEYQTAPDYSPGTLEYPPVQAGSKEQDALQVLGLDSNPPPSLGLEQHSIPSEHPSLTLDPLSITIDHNVINVADLNARSGELRVQPDCLSTFKPASHCYGPPAPDLEGHLV